MKGRADGIVAEAQMDGYRTDQMGVSPDRSRLLVSDSTAGQVIEYSMVDETLPDGAQVRMGDRLRAFPSGETRTRTTTSPRDARSCTPRSAGSIRPVTTR